MSNSTLKKTALYTLGAFSGVALSLSLQSFAVEKAEKGESLPVQSIRTMAEVYGQIKASYYQDKPNSELLKSAMKGMVVGPDPHSEYVDKKDYADLKEPTGGEFGGLGMGIGQEDGFARVIAPIEDTPAKRAGAKSGDFIVKIDDVSTRGMTVSEAVKKMRDKSGTKITLTLSRKNAGKPIVVNPTRAIIKVKSVRHHLLGSGYGYIRVSQFQEHMVPGITEAARDLTELNKGPLEDLILDLRDDPGGLLNGVVGVSAAFLKPDVNVVSIEGRDGKVGIVFKATPEDHLLSAGKDPLSGLPAELRTILLTALINSGSTSASEIMAGALQDHKRAVVVGTQSFGKGSVQTATPSSNGNVVKLTTALYYTPNDRFIQAQGIAPDMGARDKDRASESCEAGLIGHIGNPNGGEDVKSRSDYQEIDKSEAGKTDGKGRQDKKKDEADLSSRHIPNPAKGDQLRKAFELVENPAEWRKSLDLAAKKPVQKKTKKDEDK